MPDIFPGGMNPTLLILQQLAAQAAAGQGRGGMQAQAPPASLNPPALAPAASGGYATPDVRAVAAQPRMSAEERLLLGGSGSQDTESTLRQTISQIDALMAGQGAPERMGWIRGMFTQRLKPDEYASYAFRRGAMPGGNPELQQSLLDKKAMLQSQLASMEQLRWKADKLAGVQQALQTRRAPSEQMYSGGGAPWVNMTPDQSQMAPDRGLEMARLANILFPDIYDQGFMAAQERAELFPLTQEQAWLQGEKTRAEIVQTEQETRTSKASEDKYRFDIKVAESQEIRARQKHQMDLATGQVELQNKLVDQEAWVGTKVAASKAPPELSRPYFEALKILGLSKLEAKPTPERQRAYKMAVRTAETYGRAISVVEALQSEEGRNVTMLKMAEDLLKSENLGNATETVRKLVQHTAGQLIGSRDRSKKIEDIGKANGLGLAESIILDRQGVLLPADELSTLVPNMSFDNALGLALRDRDTFDKTLEGARQGQFGGGLLGALTEEEEKAKRKGKPSFFEPINSAGFVH